jgi:tryptophan synthase alpha chain
VIAHANRKALETGVTVADCLDFAHTAARTFDIPFLIMSYYNIPFRFGLNPFYNSFVGLGEFIRGLR